MPPKAPRVNSLYFSPRMNQSLSSILTYPFVIVEAPMGYGKTTAVREYLKSLRVHALWLTVESTSGAEIWHSFCHLLMNHFPQQRELAVSLLNLGVPVDDFRIKEAIRFLNQYDLRQKTVVVIDDFQLINIPEAVRFIEILIHEALENLHVVLITSSVYRGNFKTLGLKGILRHIVRQDLELNRVEVGEYFRQCGVGISEEELDTVYGYTEGWFSAVYLSMFCYLNTGTVPRDHHIHDLLRAAFFDQYSEAIRDFLLHISLFESFTIPQAAFFWTNGSVNRLLRDLTANNALITFDEASKSYRLHPILNNYLASLFRELEPQHQRRMRLKCADWHFREKNYWEAVWAYELAGDFRAALAALNEIKILAELPSRWTLLKNILRECPEEIMVENLRLIFRCALAAVYLDDQQAFEQMSHWLEQQIAMFPQEEAETRQWRGELEMLYVYSGLGDLTTLWYHLNQANNLLQEPNRVLTYETPWTMGSPSAFLYFHRVSGKLDEEVKLLKQSMTLYYELTQGHGAGADVLMEAEACFYRGELSNAERLVARAELFAGRKSQLGITIGALILKARIAVYQGRYSEAERIMRNMNELVASRGYYALIHISELCRAWVYSNLGVYERIPEWVRQGHHEKIYLGRGAYSCYYISHAQSLLVNGELNRMIDYVEVVLAAEQDTLMVEIYGHVFLAVAKYRMANYDAALQDMLLALEIAIPDRIYLPFVFCFETSRALLDMLTDQAIYKEHIQNIQRMSNHWRQTKKTILNEHFGIRNDQLTARGEEIAYWAARGYSITHIAEKLSLSPAAVRYALDEVYDKFDVHNRFSLYHFLFKR